MATSCRRVLVAFSFFEKNKEYRDNLAFFLQAALNWPPCERYQVDIVVVVNGAVCTLPIPRAVRVVRRDNVGFDFGAHAAALNEVDPDLSLYDFYFFLNSSVRGPFMPMYAIHGARAHWLDPFFDARNSGPDVRLVGTTINVLDANTQESAAFRRFLSHKDRKHLLAPLNNGQPCTHVQSMVFMADRECVALLRDHGVLPGPAVGPGMSMSSPDMSTTLVDVIASKEIFMTHVVLHAAGWNVASVLADYQGLDFRRVRKDPNPTSSCGDPCLPGACFHRTIHPYDVVFIKTNRSISPREIGSLSIVQPAVSARRTGTAPSAAAQPVATAASTRY